VARAAVVVAAADPGRDDGGGGGAPPRAVGLQEAVGIVQLLALTNEGWVVLRAAACRDAAAVVETAAGTATRERAGAGSSGVTAPAVVLLFEVLVEADVADPPPAVGERPPATTSAADDGADCGGDGAGAPPCPTPPPTS